jgi:hypothetical protein
MAAINTNKQNLFTTMKIVTHVLFFYAFFDLCSLLFSVTNKSSELVGVAVAVGRHKHPQRRENLD